MVPHIVKVGPQINFDHARLAFDDLFSDVFYRRMRGPLRTVSVRSRLEIGLEDRFQDQLERTLHHAVPYGRDRKSADFLVALFRNLAPAVPQRTIGAPDQLLLDLLEETFHPTRFDGLECHPVNSGGAIVCLRHLVGFAERLHLADVHVQTPETPRRFSLRLDVYLSPQVLQIVGRLCHFTPASHFDERITEQQGPFTPRALPRFLATTGPSSTLSSSADFPGSPVIRPTWLRRFLVGTRRASPVARRILATVLSLPPRWSKLPLQPSCVSPCCLRPPVGGSASRARHFRGHLCVHFRYGPVTCSPSNEGFVDGLQSLGFPLPCHPSYGAYGFYPRWDCLPLNTPAFAGRTTGQDPLGDPAFRQPSPGGLRLTRTILP